MYEQNHQLVTHIKIRVLTIVVYLNILCCIHKQLMVKINKTWVIEKLSNFKMNKIHLNKSQVFMQS